MVRVIGALMFSSGYFGQVLEGPRSPVEATFERIQRDTRHGDVSLLELKPVSARTFDRWAMAYVGKDEAVMPSLVGEFDLSKLTFEILISKLYSLVARELPTAI
jgi:hypothetical protein